MDTAWIRSERVTVSIWREWTYLRWVTVRIVLPVLLVQGVGVQDLEAARLV